MNRHHCRPSVEGHIFGGHLWLWLLLRVGNLLDLLRHLISVTICRKNSQVVFFEVLVLLNFPCLGGLFKLHVEELFVRVGLVFRTFVILGGVRLAAGVALATS